MEERIPLVELRSNFFFFTHTNVLPGCESIHTNHEISFSTFFFFNFQTKSALGLKGLLVSLVLLMVHVRLNVENGREEKEEKINCYMAVLHPDSTLSHSMLCAGLSTTSLRAESPLSTVSQT